MKEVKKTSGNFGNLPGPGPGRPKGSKNARTKRQLELAAAQSAEDIQGVLDAMRRSGLRGDSAAARVYLEYTVGKPQQETIHEVEVGGNLLAFLREKIGPGVL